MKVFLQVWIYFHWSQQQSSHWAQRDSD